MAAARELPDHGHELLRSEGAVHADDVRAHGVEDDCGGLRARARDCAAVLAVGELADDGDVRDVFGREQGRAHLLDVDAGLDDEVVRASVCEGFGLLLIVCVCLLEIEVAEWLDEAARGPHRPRDPGAACGGLFSEVDGGGIELGHTVRETVVLQFQAAGTEGVCLDDGRAGLDIGAMDVFHDFGLLDIHELRAAAGLEAAGLQHGAHGTVKNMNHRNTPSLYVHFLREGQL